MSDVAPWVVALIVGLVPPLIGWVRSSRKLSGKIASSEAVDLWKESAAIRAEQRDYAKSLEDRISKCEDLNRLLDLDNRELRDQVAELRRQLEAKTT